VKSRQMVLKSFPVGMPQASDFELIEADVSDTSGEDGDSGSDIPVSRSYMRGRMSGARSYADPAELGKPVPERLWGRSLQAGAQCTRRVILSPPTRDGSRSPNIGSVRRKGRHGGLSKRSIRGCADFDRCRCVGYAGSYRLRRCFGTLRPQARRDALCVSGIRCGRIHRRSNRQDQRCACDWRCPAARRRSRM